MKPAQRNVFMRIRSLRLLDNKEIQIAELKLELDMYVRNADFSTAAEIKKKLDRIRKTG